MRSLLAMEQTGLNGRRRSKIPESQTQLHHQYTAPPPLLYTATPSKCTKQFRDSLSPAEQDIPAQTGGRVCCDGDEEVQRFPLSLQ